MGSLLNDSLVIAPELFLIVSAIILLMLGSFKVKNSAKIVLYLSTITLFFVSFLEIIMPLVLSIIFNESLINFTICKRPCDSLKIALGSNRSL